MLASSLNMQNTSNVAESSRKHHVVASQSAGCRACFEAARLSLGIIAAASLIGCDSVDRAASEGRTGTDAPGVVRIDGSSTVFPISEAVAEEYQKLDRRVRVTVGVSGTGGGFKRLCAGDVDLANASRPIKPTEIEQCRKSGIEYVELPIAYDGIAIVVHPTNDWVATLTTAELARMWEPAAQSKVTKWRHVREGWPDRELHLFGAGVDSGTYDYFSEAITGKEHASRGDYTSSEDDNVLVTGVASDPIALGFFGLAYYTGNKSRLKAVAVDDGVAQNGDGPILPSPETVRDGTYQPLSRPVFVYVSRRALDRREVADFARYYLENSAKFASEVGYVPLPDLASKLTLDRLAGRKTGSLFGGKGSQIGVTIDALLAKERE